MSHIGDVIYWQERLDRERGCEYGRKFFDQVAKLAGDFNTLRFMRNRAKNAILADISDYYLVESRSYRQTVTARAEALGLIAENYDGLKDTAMSHLRWLVKVSKQ